MAHTLAYETCHAFYSRQSIRVIILGNDVILSGHRLSRVEIQRRDEKEKWLRQHRNKVLSWLLSLVAAGDGSTLKLAECMLLSQKTTQSPVLKVNNSSLKESHQTRPMYHASSSPWNFPNSSIGSVGGGGGICCFRCCSYHP